MFLTITFVLGFIVGWIINDYIDDIKRFMSNLF
jgi:uncharacterized membrane protein YciS (DUF1049 family)